jgi:hypothetical protein
VEIRADEKIQAREAAEMITKAIYEQLMKCSSFNGSVAYYGIEFDFLVNIKLFSRGIEQLEVSKAFPLEGERTEQMIPLTVDGAKQTKRGRPRKEDSPQNVNPFNSPTSMATIGR